MGIRHYEDMNLQKLDVTGEIGSTGTGHTATTLFKSFSKEIRITLPGANVLGYEEAVSCISSPEEIIAAVLVKMDGDVEGLMFFPFNLEFTNTILDELMGEGFSDFTELGEASYSTLVEAGNIIIYSYINAFSQLVGVEMELSVPSATINVFGGMLIVPIVEYGYETDKLTYFNAGFVIEGERLPGQLLIPPDADPLNGILDKLGVL